MNNEQTTKFRRGYVSQEAYLAAELMWKAAENRAVVESAVKAAASKKGRKKSRAMKVVQKSLEVEDDVRIPVLLYEESE